MASADLLFRPLPLGRLTLPHRILRAATFENLGEPDGAPSAALGTLYENLARGGVGTIITGFTYISPEGRAMHPFQAGIHDDRLIAPWQRLIDQTRRADPETRLLLQIAHAGRQTIRAMTGKPVVGAGPVRCEYFLSRVRTLREMEIPSRIRDFAAAVVRAAQAGFDGVQVHAAHGYLIHQFLSPWTNRRRDAYGTDRLLFLRQVMEEIRSRTDLPVFLKLSAAEDRPRGIQVPLMAEYLRTIGKLGVDAVEISYGTMEIALNIIRGSQPLEAVLAHNPLFRRWGRWFGPFFRHVLYGWYRQRFLPYSDLYNLDNAVKLKSVTDLPMFVTGGIRTGEQARMIVERHGLAGATLCRPFICEPDLVKRWREERGYRSRCSACNLCTVLCDSPRPLQCYLGRETAWRS